LDKIHHDGASEYFRHSMNDSHVKNMQAVLSHHRAAQVARADNEIE